MTTRRPSSSSSSSSSETEETTSRVRDISETSRDTLQTSSRIQGRSPTNTFDGTSIADTTIRSASPNTSHASGVVTRTTYDSVSTTNTSLRQQMPGGIPIIRPPVLQQRPGGYPTQAPMTSAGNQSAIRIDVASAQQQYQQRAAQPEISPYSASSVSSSGASLSSPRQQNVQGNQQAHFDVAKAIFKQADVNHDGTISREEFRQWAGNNQPTGQFQQQQQQQFANRIPAHQVYNELLGPDAFKDVILDIDYGALGGLNASFQSPGDFSGGQLPPGISIRPAYTTVDSLNYQQHMFNTARTINAGGNDNHAYDMGGGGQQFDVAKAIFNQADVNRDGAISRDEFRQWAQPATQNYSNTYQSTATSGDQGFYNAALLDGANPSVAAILQQSGIGQVIPN